MPAWKQAQKVAINGGDSQSGFHVFGEILGSAAKDFIPQSIKLLTGSHRESVKSVAKGDATIAAIDAVSFELSKHYDPRSTSKICELGKSKAVPGLPLITSVKNAKMIPKLFYSVVEAVKALPDEQKKCLMIKGVVCAHDSEYDVFNSS